MVECSNNFRAFSFSNGEYGLLCLNAFILSFLPLLSVRIPPLKQAVRTRACGGGILTHCAYAT